MYKTAANLKVRSGLLGSRVPFRRSTGSKLFDFKKLFACHVWTVQFSRGYICDITTDGEINMRIQLSSTVIPKIKEVCKVTFLTELFLF